MNWSVSLEPLFSWTMLALMLAPLLLIILASLFLRRRGALLRLIALCALALALVNPVLLDEEREPLKSVVAIIIDESPSQNVGERTAQTRQAAQAIAEKLQEYNQFETRILRAGQNESAETQVQTRLFNALSDTLRDVPPSRVAGTIMITDGQVHDIPSTIDGPSAMDGISGPIHALISGQEDEHDRRIRFEKTPRFGLVNQTMEMSYRVLDTDDATGTVPVEIYINGTLFSVDEARIGAEIPFEITLPIAGRNIVELRIPVVPGELTETNNRAATLVDGIRENLKVLLVSGEPHSGERTWRNLLKSDASVDLIHFTILRPPEKQDGTPINELSLIAFPTRELFVEKIHDFDLIIFDRYQHRDVLPILYYDYIAEYVRYGGALLIAAGPEFGGPLSIARTPLIDILPALPTGEILEEGFRPVLSNTGKRHPVTRGLEGSEHSPPDWSRWFRIISVQSPDNPPVMEGPDGRPLLMLSRQGEGRVGMFLSDQGWLWARDFEGGGPYAQLYRRIAHWLMKEPELEEERLTAEGRGMMLEITRQTLKDTIPPAKIITPSGNEHEINLEEMEPGRFRAQIEQDEVGLYQVSNEEFSALAHVGPVNAPEFSDTVSTTELLQEPAQKTGGSVRRLTAGLPNITALPANASTFSGRDWIGLRTTNDSVLKSMRRVPLFAGFAGLAVLLLAIGAVWHREGR